MQSVSGQQSIRRHAEDSREAADAIRRGQGLAALPPAWDSALCCTVVSAGAADIAI
jgi:hypothetical protein